MKYLALDIDGTLLTSQRILTDKVKESLLTAQRTQGLRLILASGRPTPGLRPLVEELELARYGGFVMPFNGGKIFEAASGKLLSAQTLDEDLIAPLYALTQRFGVNILTYTEEYILSEVAGDPYAQKEIDITGMPLHTVESFLAAVTEPLPKCLAVGPTERLIPLEAAVKEELGERVDAFRSSPYFLELVPKGINKGASLERLLTLLGDNPSELIAMGDNYNDVEMIRYAGVGVAMGNAPEDIQAQADYVTKDNDHDGVAYALEHILSTQG